MHHRNRPDELDLVYPGASYQDPPTAGPAGAPSPAGSAATSSSTRAPAAPPSSAHPSAGRTAGTGSAPAVRSAAAPGANTTLASADRAWCGWCFVTLLPGESFCCDTCYVACNTDLFGEVSGRSLAQSLGVDWRNAASTRRSGPWFCEHCGATPVARRRGWCEACILGTTPPSRSAGPVMTGLLLPPQNLDCSCEHGPSPHALHCHTSVPASFRWFTCPVCKTPFLADRTILWCPSCGIGGVQVKR